MTPRDFATTRRAACPSIMRASRVTGITRGRIWAIEFGGQAPTDSERDAVNELFAFRSQLEDLL